MADNKEPDSYLTISRRGEGKFVEKMSRFLSFALNVSTPAEAREEVKRFTNEFHDARHVCWAYVIGPTRELTMSNDNGEPSGTAGRPILGQINSLGLTDVVVIVVRYFGGVKLGTPGLIAAYRQAARLALEDAGSKEVTRMKTLKFSVPYQYYDQVMRLIKVHNLLITSQVMDMDCMTQIEVPLQIVGEVEGKLGSIPNLRFI